MRSRPLDNIPRGIEVLVKKASVDPGFKSLLLEKRSLAAAEISLDLEPEERALLDNIPAGQLEAIISGTKVQTRHVGVFLGRTAALMLAALGIIAGPTCSPATDGAAPDQPPVAEFNYVPADPTVSDPVYFADASYDDRGVISSREWDFGPNATPTSSTDTAPTVTFDTSGQHTVTLIVFDSSGQQASEIKLLDIQ